ncbi:hypothetical protein ALC60_07530 [Trachymyrmex zeteki]|uniref:Uncharacterized protein n=1 Tax=Mycetomoellerius zeteki TaxID=64791 RepID=A0A151WZM9_9HYME|nr:hypothetical protein ALC60_07530 [Trachymyrmex zeteki]
MLDMTLEDFKKKAYSLPDYYNLSNFDNEFILALLDVLHFVTRKVFLSTQHWTARLLISVSISTGTSFQYHLYKQLKVVLSKEYYSIPLARFRGPAERHLITRINENLDQQDCIREVEGSYLELSQLLVIVGYTSSKNSQIEKIQQKDVYYDNKII